MQDLQMLQSWQLHPFLRTVSFNNSAGETVSFSESREVEAGFDITNMVTFPNHSFMRVKIGRIDLEAAPGQKFSIDDNRMVWHRSFHQVPPLSVCNPSCPPGSSKEKKEGEPFCCYDCAPCPQGKISSQKVVVQAIFIKHQDTPIVRANNRDLTYTLLNELMKEIKENLDKTADKHIAQMDKNTEMVTELIIKREPVTKKTEAVEVLMMEELFRKMETVIEMKKYQEIFRADMDGMGGRQEIFGNALVAEIRQKLQPLRVRGDCEEGL
uniref:vomeronasal type-2 receptor 26-like n=1 Tax=Podarcis muralis TaxID=64176 RepID=UPI0010A0064F|nr:vomeronasal type-2 receptor 26-like [Podarcis muralis]